MGKSINNKKDILLLLLYSPGCQSKINEPIVGRTRLVKMIFLFCKEWKSFFQKNIEITPDNLYQFFPWHFGPFSKEVYDDIMFFELRGFIESYNDESEIIPEAAIEWSKWSRLVNGNMNNDPFIEFEEQSFRVSQNRLEFVKELYESLTNEQKNTLQAFKCKFSSLSLRVILKYVYTQYPEMTDKSKIRNQVLGD